MQPRMGTRLARTPARQRDESYRYVEEGRRLSAGSPLRPSKSGGSRREKREETDSAAKRAWGKEWRFRKEFIDPGLDEQI